MLAVRLRAQWCFELSWGKLKFANKNKYFCRYFVKSIFEKKVNFGKIRGTTKVITLCLEENVNVFPLCKDI